MATELLRTVRNFWQELQRRSAAARARHELHALSDRALKDIGLTRGQIDLLFR